MGRMPLTRRTEPSRVSQKPGGKPYPPVTILKVLAIAYLYRVSEQQVDQASDFNLAIKEFVGLGVDESETPADSKTGPHSQFL